MAEQVFYEIARWRLDEQLAQIRELNSRLITVFTGATALLVLFAALQDLEALTQSGLATGLASAAIGVYVALLLTALFGYRDAEVQLGPVLEELADQHQTESDARQLAAFAIWDSFSANVPLLRRKSQLVFTAVALWALDSLLLLSATLTATY